VVEALYFCLELYDLHFINFTIFDGGWSNAVSELYYYLLNNAVLISSVCAALLRVNIGIFLAQKTDSHRQLIKYIMPRLQSFKSNVCYASLLFCAHCAFSLHSCNEFVKRICAIRIVT
jgi:hypothetical protein